MTERVQKLEIEEEFLFEMGALDSLAGARRALEAAYTAYIKTQGKGKLTRKDRNLKNCLRQLEVVSREMADFYSITEL